MSQLDELRANRGKAAKAKHHARAVKDSIAGLPTSHHTLNTDIELRRISAALNTGSEEFRETFNEILSAYNMAYLLVRRYEKHYAASPLNDAVIALSEVLYEIDRRKKQTSEISATPEECAVLPGLVTNLSWLISTVPFARVKACQLVADKWMKRKVEEAHAKRKSTQPCGCDGGNGATNG